MGSIFGCTADEDDHRHALVVERTHHLVPKRECLATCRGHAHAHVHTHESHAARSAKLTTSYGMARTRVGRCAPVDELMAVPSCAHDGKEQLLDLPVSVRALRCGTRSTHTGPLPSAGVRCQTALAAAVAPRYQVREISRGSPERARLPGVGSPAGGRPHLRTQSMQNRFSD